MKIFKKLKIYWWIFTTLFMRLKIRRIGYNSFILRSTLITGGKNICIGRTVCILHGGRFEAIEHGQINIGNNVYIGQNAHITSQANLNIGNDTTILSNVVITNIDHDYSQIDIDIRKQKRIVKETQIGENCLSGHVSVILAGTILGKQVVVANSVVRGVSGLLYYCRKPC